jgi:hypothetical protein
MLFISTCFTVFMYFDYKHNKKENPPQSQNNRDICTRNNLSALMMRPLHVNASTANNHRGAPVIVNQSRAITDKRQRLQYAANGHFTRAVIFIYPLMGGIWRC